VTAKKKTKKVALRKGKKIQAQKPLTSGGHIELNSFSFGIGQ